jgi:hypothetical protein
MNSTALIHFIPTDKPSKIRFDDTGKLLYWSIREYLLSKGHQYIYITNHENPLIREWYLEHLGLPDSVLLHRHESNWKDADNFQRRCRKVIFTNDPVLISCGVKEVPDEVLTYLAESQNYDTIEIKTTLITNSGLGHNEYAVLDTEFNVIEVNANITQEMYKVGNKALLEPYEYKSHYEIVIPSKIALKEPKTKKLSIIEEKKLRQLFKNNSNCYADIDDVIPAMDEEGFIKTVNEYLFKS